MNTPQLYEELDCLTSKTLDEVATPADLERLEELIKMSKSMRKRYASLSHARVLAALGDRRGNVDFVEETAPRRRNIVNFPLFASAAAAIVALVSAWGLSKQFLLMEVPIPRKLPRTIRKANNLPAKAVFATKKEIPSVEPRNLPCNRCPLQWRLEALSEIQETKAVAGICH